MTFARAAAVNGDWLLPGALDKPPLTIYLSALSMVAFGVVADDAGVLHLDPLVGEFAGTLPNALLTVLLAGLMMRLARTLLRCERAALLAGALTAVSPYALAYGATAFTDIGLLFCAVLAWLLVVERRYEFAGVALGLAFWCKPQALFLLPLLSGQMLVQHAERDAWRRFVVPAALSLLALVVWDSARPETSLFALSAFHNAPPRWIVETVDWLPRLTHWLRLGAWLIGPPLFTLALLPLIVLGRLRQSVERLRLAFIVAYLACHVIFAFQLYDRYLLLILPPFILLAAAAAARLIVETRLLILLVMVVLAALVVGRDASPIGPDRGANAGIDALARHLNQKPVATVIYDPWLGWELGYYLGYWHDKRRVHFPMADALAAGAKSLDEIGDRYFVAPRKQPYADWLALLAAEGFVIAPDYASDAYLVYRLTPPQAQTPNN